MTETYSVNGHFVNKDPSVRALYDELLFSAKRFHHKVRISSPKGLDEELKSRLREAYLLSE